MAAIATTIDTASKEFQANRAAMSELVAELETHRAKAAEGGPRTRANVTSRVASCCRASA